MRRITKPVRRLFMAGMAAAALCSIASAETRVYQYDAAGRLVSSINAADRTTYTYDAVDNRTQVAITKAAGNTAPSAANDTAYALVNTLSNFNPTANDTDANGDKLYLTAVGTPGHGSATFVDQHILYTPTTGYYGTDSFTYTVSDGFATHSATVNMTVNHAPVANNDTFSLNVLSTNQVSGSPISNDTDAYGGTLALASVTNGAHGSVSQSGNTFTYTAASTEFRGADTFTYVVSDGLNGTASGTVTINVGPANAAPVAAYDYDSVPMGGSGYIYPLANDTDVDPLDVLSLYSVSTPTYGGNPVGSASISGNSIYFTATGMSPSITATMTYGVSDGHNNVSYGTVTVGISVNWALQGGNPQNGHYWEEIWGDYGLFDSNGSMVMWGYSYYSLAGGYHWDGSDIWYE